MGVSVAAGRMVKIERRSSIADGLSGNAPGIYAFTIVSKYVDAMVAVPENENADATMLVMWQTKIFIEPSADATVAGLLSRRSFHGKKDICLLSGEKCQPESARRVV